MADDLASRVQEFPTNRLHLMPLPIVFQCHLFEQYEKIVSEDTDSKEHRGHAGVDELGIIFAGRDGRYWPELFAERRGGVKSPRRPGDPVGPVRDEGQQSSAIGVEDAHDVVFADGGEVTFAVRHRWRGYGNCHRCTTKRQWLNLKATS